jgi:hypothetical protein
MRFESRRGQNEKRKEKMCFAIRKKHIFFTALFG